MDQNDAANGVQPGAGKTEAELEAETAARMKAESDAQPGAETAAKLAPVGKGERPAGSDVFDRDLAVVEFGVEHFLASVEDDARKLLLKLKSIPAGINHGWHTLTAELESRIQLR